jgi:dTDP-4-dehydrorhamnose reductase
MAERTILITGGTGLLGQALINNCPSGTRVIASYLGDYRMRDSGNVKYINVDIRDAKQYGKIFKDHLPDVVVHAASIGSPDYAEKNKEFTWEINVESTRKILNLAEASGAKFIFISSNGIYDGENAPYDEDSVAKPINYYGQTKLEGEKVTLGAKVSYAIVRPILMYGWNDPHERGNIVTLALAKLAKGEKMSAYADVYSNALLSDSCAEAIWKIIEKEVYASFNIAGADRTSIYELLSKAAEVFGLDRALLVPVKQGYFNELVPRPKDTSYRTEKMQNLLGVRSLSLVEGLTRMRSKRK